MSPNMETIITLLEDGDIFYDLIATHINNNPDLLNQLNDKDYKGNTVLHYAIKNLAIESLKFLLSKENIDIYARNQDNKTPMQCIPDRALLKQREEIIELLHQYEIRSLWRKVHYHQAQAQETKQEVKKEFEEFTEQYEGYISQLSILYTKLEKEKKELEEQVQDYQHNSLTKSETTGLEEQLATTHYLLNPDNSEDEDDDHQSDNERTNNQDTAPSLLTESKEDQFETTSKELCQLGFQHGGTKFKQSAWKKAFETNNLPLMVYLSIYARSIHTTEVKELSEYIENNEVRFAAAKGRLQSSIEKMDNYDRIEHITTHPMFILMIQQTYERSRINIAHSLVSDEVIVSNIYSVLRKYFENTSIKVDVSSQMLNTLFNAFDIVPLTVKIDFIDSMISKDDIKPEEFYVILDTLISTLLEKNNLVHLQQGTLRIRVQKLRTALINKFSELITINDQVAFKNIPQAEFETSKKGESLLAWISYFNKLSLVIIAQISDTKSIDKSTLLSEFYIHLAAKLRDKNNFQSMVAIITAINNNTVYRLKAVKAGISDNAKKLFKELEELVSLSGNSKNMRDTIAVLNKDKALLVPSIATYCSDLTFASDAAKEHIIREIANSLTDMQKRLPQVSPEQASTALRFAKHVTHRYDKIDGATFNDKDEYCYHQSLKLEPRQSKLSPSNLLSRDLLGNILDPKVIDGQALSSLLLRSFRRSSTSSTTKTQEGQQPTLQHSKTEMPSSRKGKKLSNENRSVTASLHAFTKP